MFVSYHDGCHFEFQNGHIIQGSKIQLTPTKFKNMPYRSSDRKVSKMYSFPFEPMINVFLSRRIYFKKLIKCINFNIANHLLIQHCSITRINRTYLYNIIIYGRGLLLFKPITSFLFIFTTVLYETIEQSRHILSFFKFEVIHAICGC